MSPHIQASPANLATVGWENGDDAARQIVHEMINHMLSSGWRMLDGLAPLNGRWSATLLYAVHWAHSPEQQNLGDASIAQYAGHADHARMQWLADQAEKGMAITLKIGDWTVGTHDTVRDLIDQAIQTNAKP